MLPNPKKLSLFPFSNVITTIIVMMNLHRSWSAKEERLIAKGKEQGYVTQQEIAGVLPEAEENLEELDELYAALLEQGVEITDQKDALIWDKGNPQRPPNCPPVHWSEMLLAAISVLHNAAWTGINRAEERYYRQEIDA